MNRSLFRTSSVSGELMLGSPSGMMVVFLGSSVFFQFWSADLAPRALVICKITAAHPPSKPYSSRFQAPWILAEAVNLISSCSLLSTQSGEGF